MITRPRCQIAGDGCNNRSVSVQRAQVAWIARDGNHGLGLVAVGFDERLETEAFESLYFGLNRGSWRRLACRKIRMGSDHATIQSTRCSLPHTQPLCVK